MKTLANIIAASINDFENYCLKQKCKRCPLSYRHNNSGMSCRQYILKNPLALKVIFKDIPLEAEIKLDPASINRP